MSIDKYIETADRRLYISLGRSWLWRFSRFVVGVVPPIGALIMLLHCCVLLSGGKLWMTEWVFYCSLLGALAWFSLSFAMGFCWVHRAFISYGMLISACIDFQRCFGFGVLLTPMRTLMVCLGVSLFAFFIRRKAWNEFYKRQKQNNYGIR